MAEGRAIGVVRVYTSRPHRFSPEEIERVRFLAAIGGAVAERARLLAQMQALLQSAQAMTASLSLKEVLQRLLEGAVKALGAKAASVRLLEPDGQNLQVAAAHGLSQEYLKKGPVLVKKSPLDRECLACKVVNIVDVKRTRKLQYPQEVLKEGIRGLIGVPLVLRGRVIGVLRLYTAVPYKFSPQEVDFLQALACQGAIAIENARLYEHVRREYEELKRDVWRWYDWGERFPQRL
jgi:GAF domain-containing protein